MPVIVFKFNTSIIVTYSPSLLYSTAISAYSLFFFFEHWEMCLMMGVQLFLKVLLQLSPIILTICPTFSKIQVNLSHLFFIFNYFTSLMNSNQELGTHYNISNTWHNIIILWVSIFLILWNIVKNLQAYRVCRHRIIISYYFLPLDENIFFVYPVPFVPEVRTFEHKFMGLLSYPI
jgi:hypothetical protein